MLGPVANRCNPDHLHARPRLRASGRANHRIRIQAANTMHHRLQRSHTPGADPAHHGQQAGADICATRAVRHSGWKCFGRERNSIARRHLRFVILSGAKDLFSLRAGTKPSGKHHFTRNAFTTMAFGCLPAGSMVNSVPTRFTPPGVRLITRTTDTSFDRASVASSK